MKKRKGMVRIVVGIILCVSQLLALMGGAMTASLTGKPMFDYGSIGSALVVSRLLGYFSPSIVGAILIIVGAVKWRESGRAISEQISEGAVQASETRQSHQDEIINPNDFQE